MWYSQIPSLLHEDTKFINSCTKLQNQPTVLHPPPKKKHTQQQQLMGKWNIRIVGVYSMSLVSTDHVGLGDGLLEGGEIVSAGADASQNQLLECGASPLCTVGAHLYRCNSHQLTVHTLQHATCITPFNKQHHTLKHTAPHLTTHLTKHSITPYYTQHHILQHIAPHNTLQHTAPHLTTHSTTPYNTQHHTLQYTAPQITNLLQYRSPNNTLNTTTLQHLSPYNRTQNATLQHIT